MASYIIIITLGIQIFIYSKMEELKTWKNKFKTRFFGAGVAPESGFKDGVKQLGKDSDQFKEKFSENKNLILGGGQTLLVICISIAFLAPQAAVRRIARNDLVFFSTTTFWTNYRGRP